jgi:thiol-disulfide isomerase/thioredoxin
MKVKRNILTLIFSIFSQFYLINCYFANSPYIKSFGKIDDFSIDIKKRPQFHGFVLIYSKYCGHCRHFAPNYIKLSEFFHKELFFYALAHNTRYNKVFKIDGYPTIFFYTGQNYTETRIGRSVQTLSKFIRKHIEYNCTEITYSNIDIAYNQIYNSEDRNFILGYFEPNSTYINSFTSITNNLLDNYLDLCFYCTDYKLIENDKEKKYENSIFKNIKGNEVRTFSRNRSDNTYYFNKNVSDNDNDKNYEQFLFNNVINLYEDINDGNALRILERIKNKNMLLFVYDTKNKDIKKKYIKFIEDLQNIITNKKDNPYIYLLINRNINYEKFKKLETFKIYSTSSNNLTDLSIFGDIDNFKNKTIEIKNAKDKKEKKENKESKERKEQKDNKKPEDNSIVSDNDNKNDNTDLDLHLLKKGNPIPDIKQNIDIQNYNALNINNSNKINNTKNNSEIHDDNLKRYLNNSLNVTKMDKNDSKQNDELNNLIKINIDYVKTKSSNNINQYNHNEVIHNKPAPSIQSSSNQFEVKKINEININPVSNKSKNSIKIYSQIPQKHKNKQKYKNIYNINKIKRNKISNNNNNIKLNKDQNKEKEKEKEKEMKNNNKHDENNDFKTKAIKYILAILIIAFIIYIIFAKYLCVGFIKVYDSQIVEFNQPNKIEII